MHRRREACRLWPCCHSERSEEPQRSTAEILRVPLRMTNCAASVLPLSHLLAPRIEIGNLVDFLLGHRACHVAHLGVAVVVARARMEVAQLCDQVILGHTLEPRRTELVIDAAVARDA